MQNQARVTLFQRFILTGNTWMSMKSKLPSILMENWKIQQVWDNLVVLWHHSITNYQCGSMNKMVCCHHSWMTSRVEFWSILDSRNVIQYSLLIAYKCRWDAVYHVWANKLRWQLDEMGYHSSNPPSPLFKIFKLPLAKG